MTSIERALITFVAASLGMAVAVSIAGGATNETQILATAYAPIPAGSALALKTVDNSDLTMQVRELMSDELQRAGYLVSDDSALVLTIGTSAPATPDDDLDLPMRVAGGNSAVGMRFKLIGSDS